MLTGKNIRLGRLFGENNNLVLVAIDHGAEFGPIPGLLNISQTGEAIRAADGVLLNPAAADSCPELFSGPDSPKLIYRITWISGYCQQWAYEQAQSCRILSVQEALNRGADMITACCLLNSGSEAVDRDNVALFARIAEEKEKCGIPLMGEFMPDNKTIRSEELHKLVYIGARMLGELGADCIKTYFTGDRFGEIVEAVPVPILVLGAEKTPKDRDSLELASKAISAGARGVVFGRNVFQADSPQKFLQALKAVVHDGATAPEAAEKYALD